MGITLGGRGRDEGGGITFGFVPMLSSPVKWLWEMEGMGKDEGRCPLWLGVWEF